MRAADRLTGVIDSKHAATTLETALALVDGDAVQGRRVLPGALVLAGAARVALFDELVADALTLGTWSSAACGSRSAAPSSSTPPRPSTSAGAATPAAARLGGGCIAGAHLRQRPGRLGARARADRTAAAPAPAALYGDAQAPWTLGSGGGRGASSSEGGHGGGRIHLAAQSLALDGGLVADGADGEITATGLSGGGGGGGIHVIVTTLVGAGRVHAHGGALPVAGGGGRIRVEAQSDTFGGAASASGGGAGAGDGSLVRD
ncbi:MAG: hypothetical protein U1F43_06505 [Myxococcota bacterium]